MRKEASLTRQGKRSITALTLGAILWAALLLWACFETLNLYTWTRRERNESDSHYKGRLEAISPQARLIVAGLFIGSVGAAALTLAIIYATRLAVMREELERQRGRRLEIEEMGIAAAGLAHETKNPLGLMRGMAQRIASENMSPQEVQELATRIIDQADLTSSRLGDFLRYAGLREPALQRVDGEATMKKAASLLESDFQEAGVNLVSSSDHIVIEADPEMLSQLLVNLLLNALKFTPEGGKVELSLKKAGAEDAILKVSDNGKGMEPGVASQIFKPYFSKRAGGCGLGLAIAKRIAERSGWEIAVDSAPGKGAAFQIKGIKLKG